MGLHRKLVILRIHISSDMKPSFITAQNKCMVCFFSMHSIKVPGHKIQSWFTIHVTQLPFRDVNEAVLYAKQDHTTISVK